MDSSESSLGRGPQLLETENAFFWRRHESLQINDIVKEKSYGACQDTKISMIKILITDKRGLCHTPLSRLHILLPWHRNRYMDHEELTEHYSQLIHKYQVIYDEHTRIMRRDPIELDAASKRQVQGPWIPDKKDREVYLKHLDDICSVEPTTFDDRIRSSFAANAYSTYILNIITELPERTQMAIRHRSSTLHSNYMQSLLPENTYFPAMPSPKEAPSPPPLLTRPPGSVQRRIRPKIFQKFQNEPTEMVGGMFLTNDESFFKVTAYKVSEHGKQYSVVFEGCVDYVCIEPEEVLEMIKDGFIIKL